ncbi:MAG: hypothetical protein EPO23_13330 [Xanthobacteraceae bacterium]|nr:MAG: hypothetical protein EPO23_13330 [Xanthobacteraceae bacterium]
MIGGFFRLIGLLALALGFIFLVYDGARSIADQTVRLTRFDQTWSDVHQSSLAALKPAVDAVAAGWGWAYVVEPVLRQPTWVVLGGLGLILMILFRRRRPLIGYTRE